MDTPKVDETEDWVYLQKTGFNNVWRRLIIGPSCVPSGMMLVSPDSLVDIHPHLPPPIALFRHLDDSSLTTLPEDFFSGMPLLNSL